MESESLRDLLHFQYFKTCTLQSRAESIGTHRNKSVADMNDLHKPALKTVAANEKAPGLQYAKHFREKFVLQFLRRHVMQHGERNHT